MKSGRPFGERRVWESKLKELVWVGVGWYPGIGVGLKTAESGRSFG